MRPSSARARGAQLVEALRQIGDQILRVFEPDVDTDAGAAGVPLAGGADTLGVHRLDQAFKAAPTGAERTGKKLSSLVMTAPSITSEWPQMYLVAAWIDTSTPCSNERNR